jgi:exosortase/archaeosortase
MLDLRLPMGLMFSLVGGMLVVYGLVTGGQADLYRRSLGINVNLWWGMVLLAFGMIMYGLSVWGTKHDKDKT